MGGPGRTTSLTFPLTGESPYPRPGALIGGLVAGSDRSRARAVLGEEVAPDVYAVEGDLVRLRYDDDDLVAVVLERPPPEITGGPLRPVLDVVGRPEAGPEYLACRDALGSTEDAVRRWGSSSGRSRRLVELGGGAELQVEDGRVLSVRVAGPSLADLFEDSTRGQVHDLLGTPGETRTSTERITDLHRYGAGDVRVDYDRRADDPVPMALSAVRAGWSVSHRFLRSRSGEFTLFLDVLGRPASDPLVLRVRGLAGVRLRMVAGRVGAVTIARGDRKAPGSARLAAFVDGMPQHPTRKDLPFGVPSSYGDLDDLREFDQGWIHVHTGDGMTISSITVSDTPPSGLRLRPWRYGDLNHWAGGR